MPRAHRKGEDHAGRESGGRRTAGGRGQRPAAGRQKTPRIFGQDRLCARGGGFRRRPGQSVALPVSGSQIRRRHIHFMLHHSRGDGRHHAAHARDRHRPQDGQGRARCVCRAQQKVQVAGLFMPGRPRHHRALLLRHRRLGGQVHRRFFGRSFRPRRERRRRRGHGRIFYKFHRRPVAAARLLSDLRGGDHLRRRVRRTEGDRAHQQGPDASARRHFRGADGLCPLPGRRAGRGRLPLHARFLQIRL